MKRLAKRWSPTLIPGRVKRACKTAVTNPKYRKELTVGVFMFNTAAILLMVNDAELIGGSMASVTNIVMAASWLWE